MMNETIYKYQLDISDEVTVPLPEGAEVLSVGTQGAALMIWVKADVNAIRTPRKFLIRGTGHPLSGREGRFVGTAQMNGPGLPSALVWHVFEAN